VSVSGNGTPPGWLPTEYVGSVDIFSDFYLRDARFEFWAEYPQKIYKTIIFPVVLYECETCSLTSREELRLRMLENRVLGRLFRPKWGEIIGFRRQFT
jgi:hypothetical protein